MSFFVDEQTGVLLLSPELADEVAGGSAGALAASAEREGSPEEAIAAGAAVVGRADVRLSLSRGGALARGWVDRQTLAAVLVAREQAGSELVLIPPQFLPDLLGRLLALGPGARAEASAIRVRSLGEPGAEGAHDELAGEVRAHWSLDVGVAQAGARVEMVDLDGQLWEVRRHDDDVQLAPSSATRAFSAIIGACAATLP